ncbi:hypothetical protein C5E06_09825 [Pseudoclavibacter sp. RFBI5]|nr:hypothetical protein C5E06_09825 [Pseudoclavibacter sp. RFBI5]
MFIGESTLKLGGYLDQDHSTGCVVGEDSDGSLTVRWDRYDANVRARRQDLALEAAWFRPVADATERTQARPNRTRSTRLRP